MVETDGFPIVNFMQYLSIECINNMHDKQVSSNKQY